MRPTFLVRPAGAHDASVITDFNLRLAWETEHLRLDPEVVRRGVGRVLAEAGLGRYFVAEDGGRVVGQCSITYEWSDWRDGMWWWLQSVYVGKDARGAGAFRSLFDHVAGEARAAGALGLRLYVEQDNRVAQEVYVRRGMQRTPYQVYEWTLPRD